MTRYRRELRAFADQTETSPRDMALARDRWNASRLERLHRDRDWSFPARIGLAGAMVAAAAALFVQLSPSGLDPQEPVALGGAVELQLREGIAITGEGEGVLSGATADRRVVLTQGGLHFEVTPDAGLNLSVETDEATVSVVGTVFDVSRDALGTAVSVARGKVRVGCAGRSALLLTAGMEGTCPSARGYLKLGRDLQAAGEPPEGVLEAIDGVGAVAAQPELRAELEVLRIDSLSRLGRHAQALDGAEAWLADPALVVGSPGRAVEMRRLAARAAAQVGGCDRALPWLEALRSSGAEGVDLVQYGSCMSAADPAAARAAFEDALSMDLDPALAARIRGLLGR